MALSRLITNGAEAPSVLVHKNDGEVEADKHRRSVAHASHRRWRCAGSLSSDRVGVLRRSPCTVHHPTDTDHEPRGRASVPASSRAVIATNHPVQVGDPAAPTVGPLSFHPYPYRAGYPTKMIIHTVRNLEQQVTIRGYRCADGLVLRFAYGDTTDLPTPPYTMKQLQSQLGSPLVVQDEIPAGDDHGRYSLFSSAGQWLITVTEGTKLVGDLGVDVG